MFDRHRLRMVRRQQDKSQRELGEAIGHDQAYVSKLERGIVTDITVTTLERLADALHVTPQHLLGRDEQEAGAS